jgi:RNA polymerase sigma factor (sigma-70 family)
MTEPTTTPAAPELDVNNVVEHLFRHEAGKILCALTRILGIEHFNLAEDVVQEALARALQRWPYYGVPKNPSAWITQTAKNLALDVLRRETTFRNKEDAIALFLDLRTPDHVGDGGMAFDSEIKDDHLRMLFVCCHPAVPQEAQVALALKTLCGFNTAEIAKAFLTTEASIAKRLTRAKQRLRDARVPFQIPTGNGLSERLESVMQTLYLLFNEGYKASSGQKLIRQELCHEAIRLVAVLAEHPVGNLPRIHALLALMLLNAARLPSRADDAGRLLRLKDQDRTKWDRNMIRRGMFHLAQSAQGNDLSEYHLQAGIAACHCVAEDYDSTDWPQILALYEQLVLIDRSPVVALNRAVAVANVQGPAAGIAAIDRIEERDKLDSYYLTHAVLGELEAQLDRLESAARHFRRAQELAEIKSEKAFLANRLRACTEVSSRR